VIDHLPGRYQHPLHDRLALGRQRRFHLHRFQHHQRLSCDDRLAFSDQHAQHLARHWCGYFRGGESARMMTAAPFLADEGERARSDRY